MNKLFFFFLLVLIIGCLLDLAFLEKIVKVDLQVILFGIWEFVFLCVDINMVNGIDIFYVFEVWEEEWISWLGVKFVKIYYKLDNKYEQVFISFMDIILSMSWGMWNVFGDMFMMVELNVIYYYEVGIENGLISLKVCLDWDGDGEEDDDYVGVYWKISFVIE